jgi:hypothetical protein
MNPATMPKASPIMTQKQEGWTAMMLSILQGYHCLNIGQVQRLMSGRYI